MSSKGSEFPTFVSHLECSYTQKRYEPDQVHGLSEAGKPILVRYDLEALARAVDKESLAERTGGFWRYREFLPVRHSKNVLDLGEVMTPLISLPKIASKLGSESGEIIVKDEGRLPTGSFKARGLGLAVAMAKELGLQHL
ncbi:MAG: pyridoxal-phosphate dependent enzyme, partial [Kiloniellales bacterium]|nr:pyridoxal-phosphate dependent enzyme [Kiloniellales bacterium]